MGNKLSHNQRKIYQAVIIIWLILFVVVTSWIVVFDLQRARTLFTENANLYYQQSNGRVHIIESILDGFAAMVSATNDLGRERLRSYAQRMLEQYAYIFMFEVVEKVPHQQIKSFTEYYRRNIYPGFEVKGFSYESDRQWQPIKAAPYYMPIVFMEPFPEQSRKVLGLDLSSNGFFMRALQESERLNSSASSDPFKLVEGDLAYIIHRPIPAPDQRVQPYSRKNGADGEFAVLVIRADTLLDREDHPLPGMRELLYKATYSETDPKGHLHLNEGPATSWLESKIFPRLRVSMMLDSISQPFVLLVEHQLGWGIISWGKLGFALLFALFSFWVMMVYARLYFRQEMARAERYLQIAKAIIVGLDRDGNVNLINRRGCEILGYTEKEILGRNWFETVLAGNSRDAVFGIFRKIMAGELAPMSKYENEIVTKNGEVHYIDWNNDIEKNQKGEIVGTLSSGQDITERKRAEEDAQLHHRDMAHVMRLSTMGEMATGMAHELNQPLTALISYCGTATSLVNSLLSPPQKLAEILERATEQAHRAADIIRHLREFVSKKDEIKEIFDLDQVIQDVINFLEWEVQESGVMIELRGGGQRRKVKADKIQIEQVLVNLVWNSLEAIEQAKIANGRVVIQSRLLPNDMIEVTVTDNGPGIDSTMANKIFEQFQTSKETGMGIGLSLSRSIIEEVHGGKLWADKNHQNGALLGFELPVIECPDQGNRPVENSKSEPS
jgi:PAS domain S-box-containing protein